MSDLVLNADDPEINWTIAFFSVSTLVEERHRWKTVPVLRRLSVSGVRLLHGVLAHLSHTSMPLYFHL